MKDNNMTNQYDLIEKNRGILSQSVIDKILLGDDETKYNLHNIGFSTETYNGLFLKNNGTDIIPEPEST